MNSASQPGADATAALPTGSDNSIMVLASHARLGNQQAVAALAAAFPAPAPAIRDGGIVDDWEEDDAPSPPPGRVLLLVQHGAPYVRVHRLMWRVRVLFNPGDLAVVSVVE